MSATPPARRKSAERRADAAVGQAEERLQCVIELAADFYWEQDEAHRFNVYRHRHPGSPNSQEYRILGKTSWELCDGPPEHGGDWEEHKAALAARAPFRHVIHRLSDSFGGTRYVSFSGQPMFDASRRFVGYRGIAQDVSVQMRSDRLVQLEHVIARILTETDDVATSLQSVLRAVCESEGWEAANFWGIEDHARALKHCAGWRSGHASFVASVIPPRGPLPDWLVASTEPAWIC